MPKITWNIPQMQKNLAEDLRARYGGMMCAKEVGTELGLKHHLSYEAWLADVPAVTVNRLKRYRVVDVAAKIYKSMEVSA